MESLIPFIIFTCSILLSVYIFTLIENKKAFWASLTLAGINLLGGWIFAIYINFVLGAMLLIMPIIILLSSYFKNRRVH